MQTSSEKADNHSKELPRDRLASMDEQGHRVYIHPSDVQGPYKRWRKAFHTVLLVLFLVLPWIQIQGKPAILLDIGQRRFSIFGLAFWAHDTPLLLLVGLSVLFGISLITAVWGRIWCGWACPETVFVDYVYRQIERWIEGNAVQRRRLAASPWTARKILLKAAKWLAFTAVTLVISHSFIAYFVGIDALAIMIRHNPYDNPSTFGVMAFITAVLLFAFGWFREQFCIVMCPYGRLQSALLDEHSRIVAYDVARGEPRRGSKPVMVEPALLQIEREIPETSVTPVPKTQGDCIDCFRCVTACPTGMDIRRGLQLECINCMACMDACDEVMRNIKKPEGLIRYTSQNEMAGKAVNHTRPRVLLLSLALVGLMGGLATILTTRPPVKVTIFNAKTTPYQMLDNKPDPMLSNQFYLTASNYTFEHGEVRLALDDSRFKIVSQVNPVQINAGKEDKQGFFITFPKSALQNGRAHVLVKLLTRADDGSWQRELTQEVPLVGPF